MSDEKDKDFLMSMDRRISEQAVVITSTQRDFMEVSHEIKEVLHRINGGLSPSVNEVRKENSEIKLALKDMSHKMDMDIQDMRDMVKESTEHTRLMVDNANKNHERTLKAIEDNHVSTLKSFEEDKILPVKQDVGFIKKTFIYGIVGAVIVFLGNKTMEVLWDRVFQKHGVVAIAP